MKLSEKVANICLEWAVVRDAGVVSRPADSCTCDDSVDVSPWTTAKFIHHHLLLLLLHIYYFVF